MDCLFCKIINGEIPSKKVYEDDRIFVFEDISPAAPVHVLIVPKKHIERIADVTSEDEELLGYLMGKIPALIKDLKLDGRGVRLVNNCNAEAGQSVFHIHFHLMGGRSFGWPPG